MANLCAVCGAEVEDVTAGAEVRFYLGPGEKIGEVWLPLCPSDVERWRPAYEREVVECRVARLVEGKARDVSRGRGHVRQLDGGEPEAPDWPPDPNARYLYDRTMGEVRRHSMTSSLGELGSVAPGERTA